MTAHLEKSRTDEFRVTTFNAYVRQPQKEGKPTRHVGMGPRKPQLSVTITRLEDSMLNGAKLVENFNEFVEREGFEE